jgi:putative tricarboxylic transport membrane protein
MRLNKNMVFGTLGLGLAAAYWHAADDIQRSFLADEVGADGVPKLLATVLAVLSGLLLLRETAVAFGGVSVLVAQGQETRPHARAFGLLVLGVLYIALMPTLGYLVTTAVFIWAVAAYAGQAPDRRLVLTAVAGSLVLWGMFDHLLGVSLPPGVWTRLGI